MYELSENTKLPIKVWANDLEEGTLKQAENLANFPFAFKHIALMPDAHLGYGMPIGGILATKDVIVPNAVGVDIGCGVIVCKLPITNISKEQIKQIFGGSKEYKGGIRGCVPVGMRHQSKKQDEDCLPDRYKLGCPFSHTKEKSFCQNWDEQRKQIGTLGGGNHFIEIQRGTDNFNYLMIHSGSRGIGFKVAKHYNDLAKKLNKRWGAAVNPKHDLAFLPFDSEEGQNYLADMQYCVAFARKNRQLMMRNCLGVIFQQLGLAETTLMCEIHDVAHNYVVLEHHFGQNVYVHRKGATRAREGDFGIIPGSQGTKSYIVKGKGDMFSFNSCSHGAGRLMSRKKAIKTLNFDAELEAMNSKDIVHSVRTKNQLDEAPSAYKDITEVMANQSDLVEIVVELTPLGCIKG